MRVTRHEFVTPRRARRGLGGQQYRETAYHASHVRCDAVADVVERHRVVPGAKHVAGKPLACLPFTLGFRVLSEARHGRRRVLRVENVLEVF